jgi:NTP pyrophosphatase (non-canonical NTP hydrolase)
MGTEANMQNTGGRVWELAKECLHDSKRWFPGTAPSLVHHCLGLAGEAGEFIDIVKKIDRGSLSIKDAAVRRMLAMEITDVFIYVLNIAGLLGIDLEETYKMKRIENERRFAGTNGRVPSAPAAAIREG